MTTEYKLTVPIIILNWNGFEDTIECVKALMAGTYQNFVVYLVDNNSKSDEQAKLEQLYQSNNKVDLILNKENLGFTKGNNEVIKTLLDKYKHVVLLNNDTKPHPDWLENLVRASDKADMVSSKMLSYSNSDLIDNLGLMVLNTGEILPIAAREAEANYNNAFRNLGPSAGAGLYSTKMLKGIGVFDEYFSTGMEDAELALRASIAGYKSIYEPRAKVLHKVGTSIKKIKSLDYSIDIQKNIYYAYFKLMPTPVILVNLPFIMLRFLILCLIGLITLRFRLVQVQFGAINRIIKDWNIIKEKRKSVITNLSWLEILKLQKFFLSVYFKYFINFILKGKKTVFE